MNPDLSVDNSLSINKGLFVVCEGVDKAGKTTVINYAQNKLDSLLKEDQKTVYNKGLGGESFLGKVSSNYPCTFLFLLQQLYFDKCRLNEELELGKIVFQDRWFYSVISYPGNDLKDDLVAELMIPPLRRPDLLVYFTCSLEERLRRLDEHRTVEHLKLINDPARIMLWEERLMKYYQNFSGNKYLLDTTVKSVEASGEELVRLVNEQIMFYDKKRL